MPGYSKNSNNGNNGARPTLLGKDPGGWSRKEWACCIPSVKRKAGLRIREGKAGDHDFMRFLASGPRVPIPTRWGRLVEPENRSYRMIRYCKLLSPPKP